MHFCAVPVPETICALSRIEVAPEHIHVRSNAVRYATAAFHDPSPENLRRASQWLGRLEAVR
jgi:hypothetical protein